MTWSLLLKSFLLSACCAFLSSTLQAQGPTSYPWWGKTTARVNVRRGSRIVTTLEKGARVSVKGLDSPGWYSVAYGGITTGRVAQEYITFVSMPFKPRAWQTPQIGSRLFLVVAGYEKPIAGISYPMLTAFDILEQDANSAVVILSNDQIVRLKLSEYPHLQLSRVPWDTANNIPTARDAPDRVLVRYYHFITAMVARPWFFVLLLLLSAGASLAVNGFDEAGRIVLVFLLVLTLLVLFIGSYIGNGYLRYINAYDSATTWLSPYRLDGVHLLPVQYSFIDPRRVAENAAGTLYPVTRILWVPLFLLLHLYFIVSIPSVIRALHYIFVPHPAEKHLSDVLSGKALDKEAVAASVGRGDIDNPPPTWVSENQKRRLDALRNRFKAEEGLLSAVINWKRKKAEFEDP